MPGGPGYPGAAAAARRRTADGAVLRARARLHPPLLGRSSTAATPRPVVGGRRANAVGGLSVAGDTAAIVLATPASFGEIVDGRPRRRDGRGAHTTMATSLADVELFAREEREFTDLRRHRGPGLAGTRPGPYRPAPLLLDIHGGPHNAWNGAADAIHLYHQVLAARGWAVLLLNPRGSDGYGEKFFTAALGAWGEADAHGLPRTAGPPRRRGGRRRRPAGRLRLQLRRLHDLLPDRAATTGSRLRSRAGWSAT